MKRTLASASAPAVGLLLGLSLACSMGGDSSWPGSSYRGEVSPPGAGRYATFDAAYQVPPDRASIAVTVQVQDASLPKVQEGMNAALAAVARVAGEPGCAAHLFDAEAPALDGSEWSASSEVRVDIALQGLTDAAARRERIGMCVDRLAPLVSTKWVVVDQVRRSVVLSAPLLLVDRPEQHRDALLARERESLAWAAGATGAPQLRPADLRCVPDGTVIVGERYLSGVTLSLRMPCRVEESDPELAEGG